MLKFCAWVLSRWQFSCLFCRCLKPLVISYCKLHLATCHLLPLQSAPDRLLLVKMFPKYGKVDSGSLYLVRLLDLCPSG